VPDLGPTRRRFAGEEDVKAYPEYRDSGLPWLGPIPAHWDIRRAKNLFRCIDVRSTTGEEELLTVSAEHGVVPRKSMKVTMFKAESYVGHKLCWPNDLVINSLWAWGRGLGVTKRHGIVSSAYGVYRLRAGGEQYADYIHHLVRSAAFHWELRVRSKGVWISRLQLTDGEFLDAPIPIPSQAEAQAMARFVVMMERRFNRLIRNRRRLTEVLNEQKQAIINRAVTRGLDPNVRLKPSGVEWLCDVPEHWEVLRLKATLSRPMRNGLFKKKEAFGTGAPFINVADVYRGNFQIEPASLERVQAAPEELRAFQVKAGDLFFVRSSLKLEGTGRSAVVVDHEANTVFDCHLVQGRPNAVRASPRFLAFQLNSFSLRHYLISRANVVTMATVGQNVLSTCPVWLPPLSEQANVLQHIDEESERLDAITSRAQREISLLREYRTRLIADVVTGKVDVRHLTPQGGDMGEADALALPDEINEMGAAEGADDEEAELVEEVADADD